MFRCSKDIYVLSNSLHLDLKTYLGSEEVWNERGDDWGDQHHLSSFIAKYHRSLTIPSIHQKTLSTPCIEQRSAPDQQHRSSDCLFCIQPSTTSPMMFCRRSSVFLALAVPSLVSAQDLITANRELQLVKAGEAPFEITDVLRKSSDPDGIVAVCPVKVPTRYFDPLRG